MRILLYFFLGLLLVSAGIFAPRRTQATTTTIQGQLVERSAFVGPYSGRTFTFAVYFDAQNQRINKYYLDE